MSTVSVESDSAVWSGVFTLAFTSGVKTRISGEIPWSRLFAGVDVEDLIDDILAGIGADGSLFIEITLPCGAVVHIEAGCEDGDTDIHSVTVIGDIEPSGLTGCWMS